MRTNSNRILKGGAMVLFAHIFQKGFTAIFILVFSQLLPLRLFGELMLAITLVNLLSLVSLFGLPSALQKFCSGEANHDTVEHYRRIATMGLVSTSVIGLLLWLFRVPLANWFEPSDSFQALMAIAGVAVFTQGIFRIGYEALRAREDGRSYFLVDNVLSVSKISLPVVAWFITGSVPAVLAGFAMAYGIAALFALRRLKIKPQLTGIWNRSSISVAAFALPAWVAGFTYIFAQHVDKIMLGLLSEARYVGLYAAASAIAMLLTLFHTAFAAIFTPIAADYSRNGRQKELHSGYIWVAKWAMFVCGVGLLIFAGVGEYGLQLFGNEFATPPVYLVLIILGLFYLAGSTLGPSGPVLQMSGSNVHESANAGAFLGINIIANLILIPRLGLVGAALATLIAGLCRNAMQWFQLKRRNQLQPIPAASLLVFSSIVLFVALTAQAPMFSIERIGFAVAGLLVLCLLQITRLDERERQLLRNLKDNPLEFSQLIKKETFS